MMEKRKVNNIYIYEPLLEVSMEVQPVTPLWKNSSMDTGISWKSLFISVGI